MTASVQFYEKVYQLHGELKQQEEEQFNLQTELNRLMPSTQQKPAHYNVNGFSSLITNNGNSPVPPPAVSYLLSNGFAAANSSPENLTLKKSNGVDRIQEEERKRKVRNDMILKKVQELESTAAVFAARSEKLRILKTEYDSMVRRYVAQKQTGKLPLTRLNLLSSSTPNMVTLPSSGPAGISKSCVGVNTDITGPVQPVPPLPPRQFQNGFPQGYLGWNDETSALLGNNKAAPKDLAYSQFMATGVAPPVLTTPTATSALGSAKRFHEVVSASQTLLDQAVKKQPEAEKLMEEEAEQKLRHNRYFDISTTSESEVTSTKGLKKFEPKIPINMTSIDDTETTVSETTASEVQPPPPPAMSVMKSMSTMTRRLSVDLVSETSEVQVLDQVYGATKTPMGREEDPFMALQADLAPGGVDGGEFREEDESLATSVGDSVMDSIQNRLENVVGKMEIETPEEVPVQDAQVAPKPATNGKAGGGLNFGVFAAERATSAGDQGKEEEKRVDPIMTVICKFDQIEDEFGESNKLELAPVGSLKAVGGKNEEAQKVATSAGVQKSKKFKIKTNFDSDSEDVSEAVPIPAKPAFSVQDKNATKKDDEYDDDFDDFFNV